MAGWFLAATQAVVRWAAPFGADGRWVAEFEGAQVKRIERRPLPPPRINYCDVSFQLEFPDLRLIRRPPFTMLTDESPACAERWLTTLFKLQTEFCARFGTLTEGLGLPDHAQVLLFSDEAAYRACQRRIMGRRPYMPGFYVPAQWRLVLFDQRHASALGEVLEQLDFQSEKAQVRATTDAAAARLRLFYLNRACELLRHAERENRRIVRHEGSHQLFHATGVLVEDAMPGWLAEGLALWCEPSELGAMDLGYANQVQAAWGRWRWIPLAELLGHRDQGGHGFFDGDRHRELAYAESWSLVRLLMRPACQPQFFAYLRHLRNLNAAADIRSTPPLDLLCRFLGLTPKELEARWAASIKRLPFDPD